MNKIHPKITRFLFQALQYLIRGGILTALFSAVFVEQDLFFPFTSSKGFLFLAAVQFTFVFWLLLIILDEAYRPKRNLVSIALLSLLLSMTLSTLTSQDVNRGIWSTYERTSGLIVQAHLFVFFLMLSSFLRQQRDWRQFFTASISIASVVSAAGLLDHFGNNSLVELLTKSAHWPHGVNGVVRPGATFGNTSFMGSYLQINAFFSIYLFLTVKGKSKLAIAIIFIMISSAIFLNPGGRAVKATYLCGLFVVVLTKILTRTNSPRVRKIVLGSLFVSVPAAVVLGVLISFSHDVLPVEIRNVKGYTERAINWNAAATGFFEKPFVGWGPENYDLMFYQNFDPAILVGSGRSIGEPWFDRAHNIIFDTLVATGVIGFAAYFLALVGAVIMLTRRLAQNGRESLNEYIVFTVLLLCHFVQNLTVFDMLSSSLLLYAAYAFTSHRSLEMESLYDGKRRFELGNRFLILSWVFSIPSIVIAYYYCVYIPRVGAKAVGALEGVPNNSDILRRFQFASNSSSMGKHEVRFRLAEVAMARLRSTNNAETGLLKLTELNYVLGELEKSVAVSPLNVRIASTEGRLRANAAVWSFENLGEKDRPDLSALDYVNTSIPVYKKIIEMCDNHVLTYHDLSRALVYKGYITGELSFFKDALDIAERAVELEPRLFASHDLTIDIAASLLGDKRLASEKFESALKIDKSWRASLIRRIREAE